MTGAHWRAGRYVFSSQDGSGTESECFASIEDAATAQYNGLADALAHAYEEWDLGIDDVRPVWIAAGHLKEWEDPALVFDSGSNDVAEWLRSGREIRIGDWFIAPCSGLAPPRGPCTVHPSEG